MCVCVDAFFLRVRPLHRKLSRMFVVSGGVSLSMQSSTIQNASSSAVAQCVGCRYGVRKWQVFNKCCKSYLSTLFSLSIDTHNKVARAILGDVFNFKSVFCISATNGIVVFMCSLMVSGKCQVSVIYCPVSCSLVYLCLVHKVMKRVHKTLVSSFIF